MTPDGVCLDELAVISYRPADFTYCPTWDAMAYVACVIDAFSRRIPGWRAATTMTTALVPDALEHAVWTPRRTANWADRPATDTSTVRPPAALSSPAASSVLSGPGLRSPGPILAGPRAVALPMPPPTPVTSTVLPAIGPLWSCPMVVPGGLRGGGCLRR